MMKHRAMMLGLLILTFIVGAWVLCLGTTGIDLGIFDAQDAVLWQIRLPRVLLAAMAGAALAAAGVSLQAILQNPLADPYVVGVSGGAALGGVVAMTLHTHGPLAVPIWAFGGAAASAAMLWGLTRLTGRHDPLTLLLAGTILNATSGAVVILIRTAVTANKAQEILFWLMGAIGSEAPATLLTMAASVGVGLTILLAGRGALNLLSLGEENAMALGLPVPRVRWALFLAAALLVGAVVAIAGMIGFVGLVVPHITRRLVSADHQHLLPCAILLGAIFLMLADAAARLSFWLLGSEIPVGAITAIIGGPFFLTLLLWPRE